MRLLWKQLKCKLQVEASCDLETTLITALFSIQCGGQLPDQQHVREMRKMLRCMLQAVPLVDSTPNLPEEQLQTMVGDVSCTAGDRVLCTGSALLSAAAPIPQPAFSCATSMVVLCPPATVPVLALAPSEFFCTSEYGFEHVGSQPMPLAQPSHSEQTPLAPLPLLPLASSVWHTAPPLAVLAPPLLEVFPQPAPQLAAVDQVPSTELPQMPYTIAVQPTFPLSLIEQPATIDVAATQRTAIDEKFEAAASLIEMSGVGLSEPQIE